ncbi:hypothetical protein M8J77_015878 [Diaphorina citri]|nr:hypothetical protein M8J77_015878 [Diaphorina citri]
MAQSLQVCGSMLFLSSMISIAESMECISGDKNFSCPHNDFPAHYTSCCVDDTNYNGTVLCCPTLGPKMFNINSSFIMTISIIVIISCLGLAAMFIICCFWSPCPLFDTCRVNYGRRVNIAYAKEEEALNLPPEDDNCSHYSPRHITIKPLDSDA